MARLDGTIQRRDDFDVRDAREARTGANIRANYCWAQSSAIQRQKTRETASPGGDRPDRSVAKAANRNRGAKDCEEHRISARHSQRNFDEIAATNLLAETVKYSSVIKTQKHDQVSQNQMRRDPLQVKN